MNSTETKEVKFDKLEYVRGEIEHRGIYRCPPGTCVTARAPGRIYTWQFYLRRCLFNPKFAFSAAELLLDKLPSHDIQIAACEDAGVTLGFAMSTILGTPLLSIKKTRKAYGLLNFTEGVVSGAPIVLVDDLAGSQETLRKSTRTLQAFGLPIADQYVALINKTKGTHDTYVKDKELISLLTCEDFELTWEEYAEKYKKDPVFGPHY
jgi:orotate phosphoribosyltransferase